MENRWHISRMLAAGAVAALAATLAACGSSPKPPVSSKAATIAAITTNWEKFFNAQTPEKTRVSLLQDGSQFPAVALEPTALSSEATAKVLKVTNVTPSQATVTYDVLLGTTVALKNQVGTAVFQDGTWKVGVGSFCGLLLLETGGKNMPPVCSTTSSPSASPSS